MTTEREDQSFCCSELATESVPGKPECRACTILTNARAFQFPLSTSNMSSSSSSHFKDRGTLIDVQARV